ncbi:hypothetical protein [Devosia sp.]|uniref:hypothetical protein n=1 Tax=Devosia sp. TaxID=1871048 RepID=UPI002AFFAD67|nr:hypothetical protein [Devosia sp.]
MAPTDDTTGELSRLLRASLMTLAETGQVDAACRMAGEACRILRHDQPRNWQIFNALLHRLSARAPAVGERRAEEARRL